MKSVTLFASIVFGLVGIFSVSSTAAQAEQRVLEETHSATELRGLELVAGDGQVDISTSVDGQIHLQLRVKARKSSDDEWWSGLRSWFLSSRFEDQDELLAAVEMQAKRDGDRLVVRPLPRGRTRETRIAERWTIRRL